MTVPQILPGGLPLWTADHGAARLRFIGRSTEAYEEASALLARLAPERTRLARARQIHSAKVLEARAGLCGEGDALITTESHLALTIATADCVPIAVADSNGRALAAVHAGWRGIRAGVVPRTVERMAALTDARLAAWVGPAIGSCCYEVGDEVAHAVAEVSAPGVVARGEAKPHLDLRAAVSTQLEAAGVAQVHHFDRCTRCHPELLWSYRRDGRAAGRNLLLAWIEAG